MILIRIQHIQRTASYVLLSVMQISTMRLEYHREYPKAARHKKKHFLCPCNYQYMNASTNIELTFTIAGFSGSGIVLTVYREPSMAVTVISMIRSTTTNVKTMTAKCQSCRNYKFGIVFIGVEFYTRRKQREKGF